LHRGQNIATSCCLCGSLNHNQYLFKRKTEEGRPTAAESVRRIIVVRDLDVKENSFGQLDLTSSMPHLVTKLA